MAVNFPNSPAENELWTPDGRAYYVFKTPAWRQVFGQAPLRNRIVNPSMQHSQLNGNTAGSTNQYYAADQWLVAFTTPGAFTYGRGGGPGNYVVDFTVTTGTASPGYAIFYHNIEGQRLTDFLWGTASARQAVLSFTFFTNISGQFSATVRNSDYTRSFVQPFTVTPAQVNQWTRRTIVVPGDVTGTWVTSTAAGMNIMITIAAGGSLQPAGWYGANLLGATGQTNGMATAGNLFRLGDVSLYLDVNGRGVPQRLDMPGVFDSYRNCQRYLEKAGITAAGALPVEPLMAWGYKAMKRTVPAMTIIQGVAYGIAYTPIAWDGNWGFRENPQGTNAVDHMVLLDSRM